MHLPTLEMEKVTALCEAVESLIRASEFELALQVMEKMEHASALITDFHYTKAKTFVGTRNRTAALNEIFLELQSDENHALAFQLYLSILSEYCQANSHEPAFLLPLLKTLTDNFESNQENNTLYLRFPRNYVDPTSYFNAFDWLNFIINHGREFNEFFRLLHDEYSRSLIVPLLAFRCLGGKRIRLPMNQPSYWEKAELAKTMVKQHRVLYTGSEDWHLDHCNIDPLGYPIDFLAVPGVILNTFLMKQYEYNHGPTTITAEPGDYVIDAGGCWGDTALYFAHNVGPDGKIFCFEFLPSNLNIIDRNLDLNPELKQRIQIINNALWDSSNELIGYNDFGPGSRLSDQQCSKHAQTKSIDDFVAESNIKKIDFIKMDIESAELAALKGAEKTLKTHKPKLAICMYHRQEDFITIPAYLHSLGIGYEFYLDHFTIYGEETILFCK